MAVKTSWAAGDVLTAADLTDTFAAKAPLALSINAQTGTSYTLAIADSGRVVTMTNAAASTVTIPTNASVAVPIGSSVEVVNLSTGVNTTVSAAGGVTFNGGPVVLSPGSSVTLVKIGTDAWMAQGQGSPGLVHINTTTFSAVGSVSVNNCFTSAYDNYRIMLSVTGSTSLNVNMRLRVGGTDASGANYGWFGVYGGSLAPAADNNASQTSWRAVSGATDNRTAAIDLFDPALAEASSGLNVNRASTLASLHMFSHSLATAYDGFSLIASTGNITGTVRVYGYRS